MAEKTTAEEKSFAFMFFGKAGLIRAKKNCPVKLVMPTGQSRRAGLVWPGRQVCRERAHDQLDDSEGQHAGRDAADARQNHSHTPVLHLDLRLVHDSSVNAKLVGKTMLRDYPQLNSARCSEPPARNVAEWGPVSLSWPPVRRMHSSSQKTSMEAVVQRKRGMNLACTRTVFFRQKTVGRNGGG